MILRVKVFWDGETWRVDLPQYAMVPGSFLPLGGGGLTPDGVLADFDPTLPQFSTLTCEVEVPELFIDPKTGEVDIEKIRQIYEGQANWGAPDRQLNI